jgi:hypothetical protein
MDSNATRRGISRLVKKPIVRLWESIRPKKLRGQADIKDRDGGRHASSDWVGDIAGSSGVGMSSTDPLPPATIYPQHQSLPDLPIPPVSFPTSPLHESQTSSSPAITYPSASFPNTSQSDQFSGMSVSPTASAVPPAASFVPSPGPAALPVSPPAASSVSLPAASPVSPPAAAPIPHLQSHPSNVLNQSGNTLSESYLLIYNVYLILS